MSAQLSEPSSDQGQPAIDQSLNIYHAIDLNRHKSATLAIQTAEGYAQYHSPDPIEFVCILMPVSPITGPTCSPLAVRRAPTEEESLILGCRIGLHCMQSLSDQDPCSSWGREEDQVPKRSTEDHQPTFVLFGEPLAWSISR